MTKLITGATGNIGSLVVDRLLASGEQPRLLVRDAERARQRFGEHVEIVVGDLGDEAALSQAMADVAAVFLVTSGPQIPELDALAGRVAARAAVTHLVKLSSLDARQQVGTGVWHARGECALAESGVGFTFVQPTGFMSNALYWARSIRDEGVVRSATGEGRIPFVHPADIADVVVAVLAAPPLGSALPLTGPTALSYREMVDEIGTEIDRPLRFEQLTEDEVRQQQRTWGAEAAMVEARLSIFRAIREGHMAEVFDGVKRTLGRPPLPFRRWVIEHAAAFR
jgi:uncharacterized protein YbjT (DUF2867 family)